MKLADMFERDTRTDGTPFRKLKDEYHDGWLHEAIREAHDGMLPNDWVYDLCHSVACRIDEDRFDEDMIHEFADGEVDVYNNARFAWAAEFCNTNIYEEATDRAKDMGTETTDPTELIAVVQYCAIERIAQVIMSAADENVGDESEEA